MSGEGAFQMRAAKPVKTQRSRWLRQNSTKAETKLWNRLRSRAIGGFKFVRQEPIGPFIVDFVCRERHLIIEVDGGQHAESQRDAKRDKWLAEHRYRVLRFWNNEVLSNMDGVLEVIASALQEEMPPHPDAAREARDIRPLPASGER